MGVGSNEDLNFGIIKPAPLTPTLVYTLKKKKDR